MSEQLGAYIYTQSSVRLTSDTLALADFTRLRKHERVCDLGCGAGAIILLLLGKEPTLTLSGVELLRSVCEDARYNMSQNELDIPIVNSDWLDFALNNQSCFDLVVSNPPYYKKTHGAVSPYNERSVARTGDENTLPSLCQSAQRLLKYGGRFTLCYPASQLVALFFCLREHGLEPKRLLLKGKLSCVEAKKGGKAGLIIDSFRGLP